MVKRVSKTSSKIPSLMFRQALVSKYARNEKRRLKRNAEIFNTHANRILHPKCKMALVARCTKMAPACGYVYANDASAIHHNPPTTIRAKNAMTVAQSYKIFSTTINFGRVVTGENVATSCTISQTLAGHFLRAFPGLWP